MKKLTNQLISFILILSMLCSLSITAFAANRPLSPAEYVGSQEEIDAAKQAFLSLTEQERWIYLETLKTASDAEIEFLKPILSRNVLLLEEHSRRWLHLWHRPLLLRCPKKW